MEINLYNSLFLASGAITVYHIYPYLLTEENLQFFIKTIIFTSGIFFSSKLLFNFSYFKEDKTHLSFPFAVDKGAPCKISHKFHTKKYIIHLDYLDSYSKEHKEVFISEFKEDDTVFHTHCGDKIVISYNPDDSSMIINSNEMFFYGKITIIEMFGN
jgi:hypothetical protein